MVTSAWKQRSAQLVRATGRVFTLSRSTHPSPPAKWLKRRRAAAFWAVVGFGLAGVTLPPVQAQDASFTLPDQSGNGRDGMFVGTGAFSASVPAGLSSSTASFDMTGQVRIDTDYTGVTGANPRTIAGWINPANRNDGVIIEWGALAAAERWTVRLEAGRVRMEVQNGYARGEAMLNEGTWHHIAVTFEGTSIADGVKFFVDGVETPFNGSSDRVVNTSDARTVRFGARWDFDARWFTGHMDDFGVWSRALSPAEIGDLAGGAPVTSLPTGLELNYDFEAQATVPLTADFGSIRFLEILDDLSFPDGVFELAPVEEGSIVGDSGNIIVDQSGNDRGALVYNHNEENPGAFSSNVAENLTSSTASYDLHGQVLLTAVGYKGISGANPRTVAGWVFPNNTTHPGTIFEWGERTAGKKFNLRLDEIGRVRSEVQNGYALSAGTLTANVWNHVAVTFEGTTVNEGLKIYINGVEHDYAATGDQVVDTGTEFDVRFGARYDADARFFDGNMDDFGIWNRALTPEEIATLAGGAAVAANATGLELYYGFEEGLTGIEVTSLPGELSGNLAITTANPLGTPTGDLVPYLGFEIDRPTTVYIAYDQNATVPAWISNQYTQSGMQVGTTAGTFDLWERTLDARERVAMLWDNTTWDASDSNYWVILSHGPEAITDAGDISFVRSTPGTDFWRLEPHFWTLASGATVGEHEAKMVSDFVNFDSASGFDVSADIRLPRFEQDGDQSIGLILMGSGDAGLRAEWLPREAGGGSTLRLVDSDSGTVLESAPWSGVAPTAINNDVEADGQSTSTFAAGWPIYAGGGMSTVFEAGFEDGEPAWTSGSFNASPNQWEIGSPSTGPAYAVEDQNVAATRLDGNYEAESASWLLSPVIDLTDVSHAVLQFQEYMDVDTFTLDGELFHYGAVSIVDADTAEKTLVASYSEDILSWTQRQIDLNAFAGQRIQVEFAFYSDDYVANAGGGWYLDAVEVLGSGVTIEVMPEYLAVNGVLTGIPTDKNGLDATSESHLQFTVNDVGEGDGVAVYVAWHSKAAGLEPDWLRENFTLTDHYVGVSGGLGQYRLWARDYQDGEAVTLGGASAPGGGPFPEGTGNYFVLLGDERAGQETIYTLNAVGTLAEGSWNVSFTLSDQSGNTQSIATTVADDSAWGRQFGLAMYHEVQNEGGLWSEELWHIFNFSIGFAEGSVPAGFDAWREEHFAGQLDDPEVSGPDASPAGDGVPNLMKYALDLDPWAPATSADLPWLDSTGEETLVLVYWERTDIDDIEYIPEVSEDLIEWQSGDPHVVKTPGDVVGNVREVEAIGNLSAGAGKGFLRLTVQQKE